MIVPFFVTDGDGIIVRTGRCQTEALAGQGGDGLTVREGEADDGSQRWDVRTSELVPYTPPEEDPAAVLAARRAGMAITPRQLFIGLVAGGYCTPQEGIAAATNGAMPAAVEGAISTLSAGDQVAARITWARMQTVERMDPLVGLLAAAVGITDAEIDAFFEGCASI